MQSLEWLDVALFRFINVTLKNALFDWALPHFDSNAAFIPVVVLASAWLVLKGGLRGRLFALFLLLTFVIGDPVIVSSLKRFINRPRPFEILEDIHLLVPRMENRSMPSGHAANWFAGAAVCYWFYRRSIWFMLPMAFIEGFSRVYLGVHYPSDVLAGATIGVGYVVAVLWAAEAVWRRAGPRWFPLWHRAVPSLIYPDEAGLTAAREEGVSSVTPASAAVRDAQWLHLAYVLLGVSFLGNIVFLLLGQLELSEDEAYQWLWSKHLALSYFSKPPLIAYTQFLGTTLWGDTVFGIRFFSPVLAAIGGFLVIRFLAQEVSGFVAFLSVLIISATPLLQVGATLMTIDSLSVLFWLAAMVTGWKAVRDDSTAAWFWTGLWMGLGFLSKYIALFQWVCWIVFFALWPAARAQLRRPGPYLALLVNLLCTVPVLAWNAQNGWITLTHLADRGGLDRSWQPSLRFVWDFLGAEVGLLNPVFFVGMIWAAVAFWKRRPRTAWAVYVFSMGAPLFLFYFIYSFRARVQPNWIAPAVLPLFCLMLMFWASRAREGSRLVKHGLMAGVTIGLVAVSVLHDPRVFAKLFSRPLPMELDPLRRVLGWKEMARSVNAARMELAAEGKPTFVIASHYGTTSLLTFYIPEAKAGVPDNPLVYVLSSPHPKNQFYFWQGYESRKGHNAIYIASVDKSDRSIPPRLQEQFASVTPLGSRDILYKGRVFHRIQLFACRDLR